MYLFSSFVTFSCFSDSSSATFVTLRYFSDSSHATVVILLCDNFVSLLSHYNSKEKTDTTRPIVVTTPAQHHKGIQGKNEPQVFNSTIVVSTGKNIDGDKGRAVTYRLLIMSTRVKHKKCTQLFCTKIVASAVLPPSEKKKRQIDEKMEQRTPTDFLL